MRLTGNALVDETKTFLWFHLFQRTDRTAVASNQPQTLMITCI